MQTPRLNSLLLVLSAATALGSAPAQRAAPPSKSLSLHVDSGWLDNDTAASRVVYSNVVKIDGALWLRLVFDKTNLPDGSRLEITSAKDHAMQRLDAHSLRDYGYSSAFFNGASVRLDLVAGPRTKGNRVLVVGATAGIAGAGGLDSLCGTKDNRTQSKDPRQGRLSTGCTGFLVNSDVMISAGHCIGSTAMILSFNIPNSTKTGVLVAAHPDDQYPLVMSSIQMLNNGLGQDWAVARVGYNSNTGKLPGDAQGAWYGIGAMPSTTNQNIRVTGYGETNPKDYLNQVQKTHVGPLIQIATNSLAYRTDTTAGNSGSPVIHEKNGNVIGIHTHDGCSTTSGTANRGTRIDRGDITTAIRNLNGKDGKYESYGQGCKGSNNLVPRLAGGANPQIGRLVNVTCSNLLQNAFGVILVGTSDKKDKAGYSLPLELSFLGMPGCYQLTSISVIEPRIAVIGGSIGLLDYIPRDPNLIGSQFYMQYMTSDVPANKFGAVLSNGLKVTIGG